MVDGMARFLPILSFILFALWSPRLLFADQDRMEDVYRGFRSTQSGVGLHEVVIGLLLIGGISVLLVLFSWILHWQQRRRHYSSPRELFLSLCRAHRLRWKECWWLWQLARQQHLEDPGRLFLEPERFDASRIPPSLRRRQSEFDRLREQLFRAAAEEPETKPLNPPEASPAFSPGGAALPPASAPPTLNIPPWTSSAAETSTPVAPVE
jgi:hypothetical protein